MNVIASSDRNAEGLHRRGPAKHPLALTTGQAARFCLVTADTVVAWIKKGQLPAQRTLGGRYRIFVRDLRRFMVEHDMSTAALDGEFQLPVYCWEYCPHARSGHEDACRSCLVYQARALRCFTLKFKSFPGGAPDPDCEKCEYFRYCLGLIGQPSPGSAAQTTSHHPPGRTRPRPLTARRGPAGLPSSKKGQR